MNLETERLRFESVGESTDPDQVLPFFNSNPERFEKMRGVDQDERAVWIMRKAL